jgi:hypothetical protein
MSANVKPLFQDQEATYSASVSHAGITIEVGGFQSRAQAASVLAREMQLRGWKFREHFWQIGRPRDPRL